MMQSCPIISLKSFSHENDDGLPKLADQLFDALSDFGSVIIVDHGIDPKLYRKVFTDFKNFFDKPLEEKLIYQLDPKSAFRGYYPVGSTSTSKLMGKTGYPADPVERWRFGPLEPRLPFADSSSNFVVGWAPNVYAECFADSCKEFYKAMNNLAQKLYDILSVAIGQPKNYLHRLCQNSMNMLSVVHYPSILPIENQQERMAAHTDKNLFTILLPDDTKDSLRVQSKSGQWVFVNQPGPEHVLLLLGDAMSYLTNNRWTGTTHAVSFPTDLTSLKSRLSFQLWAAMTSNSVLQCAPKFLDETCNTSSNMTFKEFSRLALQKYLSLDIAD